MTRRATSSKLMLVRDGRGGGTSPGTAPVRRYRLARLRFDSAPADPQKRFEHLKRVHD